ncbi:MAG: hypothetical protein JXA97_03670 [Anaerolineales bacterium]|nr:hypothetical protein [Anaerolineales bacterium]
MKKTEPRIFLGILLIAAGGLFMLQNLGVIPEAAAWFWSIAFVVGGLGFLYFLYHDRSHWWPVIPGFSLIGIGATIGLSELGFDSVAGALILAMIGLSFWVVYAMDRSNWWAIIPGGILASLALMILIEPWLPSEAPVGVMFLGFAATFIAVRYLPNTEADMRWAFIPALVLGIMGMAFLVAAVSLMEYVFPAAIIVAGVFLIVRALGARSAG